MMESPVTYVEYSAMSYMDQKAFYNQACERALVHMQKSEVDVPDFASAQKLMFESELFSTCKILNCGIVLTLRRAKPEALNP